MLGALAFLLLIAFMPQSLFGENYLGFGYLVKNGEVTITNYTGKSLSLAFPHEIDGIPVRNIETTTPISILTNGCPASSVLIPNSITRIGSAAFHDYTNLTTLIIPKSITSIGDDTFTRCISLIITTIPNSVTNIGDSPFSGCTSLKDINVETGNHAYKSDQGVLFDGSGSTLVQFPPGRTCDQYKVPNSVSSIRDKAFVGCVNLKEIELPTSVTSIGKHAFEGCTNLVRIKMPDSVTNIGNAAFTKCTSLKEITLPKNLSAINDFAFNDCSSLTNVMFPEKVKKIGHSSFQGCTSLLDINIPTSVTNVGRHSFQGCKSARNLSLPNSPMSISEQAFAKCTSLTTLNIPASITKIGYYAFSECSGLKSIIVPSSIKDIEKGAFYECLIPADRKFNGAKVIQPQGDIGFAVGTGLNGENVTIYKIEVSDNMNDWTRIFQSLNQLPTNKAFVRIQKIEPDNVAAKLAEAEALVRDSLYPDLDNENKYRDAYLINRQEHGEATEHSVKALWLLSACQIYKANCAINRKEYQRLLKEAKENAETLIKITKSQPNYKKEYESGMDIIADVQIHNRQYNDAIVTLSELARTPDLSNDRNRPNAKTGALVKLCSLYAITGNIEKEKEIELKAGMAARNKEVKYIPGGECQPNERWGENVKDLLNFEKRDLAFNKIYQNSGEKASFQMHGAIKQVILCKRPNKEPIFILLCRTLNPCDNGNFSEEGGAVYVVDSKGKTIPFAMSNLSGEGFIGDVLKNGYAQIVESSSITYIDEFGENTDNPQRKDYTIINIYQVDEGMPLVLAAKDNNCRTLLCKNDDFSENPKIYLYENKKIVGSIFYNKSISQWRTENNFIGLCNNPQWRSPINNACPSRYEEISNEEAWNFIRHPHIMDFINNPQAEKKAESGNTENQYLLGSYYSSNINGTKKDVKKGADWLEVAAEKGHARAQYEFGMLCLESAGVAKSEEDAVKWFLKASAQSVGDAQVNLTQIFRNGQGEAKFDKEVYKQAFAWLLSQAELGNSEMQFAVSMSYYNGNSVPKNENEGLRWMTAAADNGNSVAATVLGQNYLDGSLGAAKDGKTALKWFIKGAETGDPIAENSVGDCYFDGVGTEPNPKEAVKWYCKAAGHDFPSSVLADCYFFGEGVAKDEKEAVKYYIKTAESGIFWSQYMLGKCFRDGVGVPRNEAESEKWFTKADVSAKEFIDWSCKTNVAVDVQSQYFLGKIYLNGIGTTKDEKEAAKWFAKAAENGHRRAQIALESLQEAKK